jgi:hypothetical protein
VTDLEVPGKLSNSMQRNPDRMVGAMTVRRWPLTVGLVFDPGSVYVGFVADKVALEQVSL